MSSSLYQTTVTPLDEFGGPDERYALVGTLPSGEFVYHAQPGAPALLGVTLYDEAIPWDWPQLRTDFPEIADYVLLAVWEIMDDDGDGNLIARQVRGTMAECYAGGHTPVLVDQPPHYFSGDM